MEAENVSGRANKVDAILSFLEGCDSSHHTRKDVAIEDNLTQESPTSLLNLIKAQVVDVKLQLKKERDVLDRTRERHAVDIQQKELLWTNEKKELQRTSLLQKEEYEKALNRQLEFVDKLLVDKTNLTQKGDQLMKQIETQTVSTRQKLMERDRIWTSKVERMRRQWEDEEKNRRALWAHDKERVIHASVIEVNDVKRKQVEKNFQKLLKDADLRMEKALQQQKDILLKEADNRVASVRNELSQEKDTSIQLIQEGKSREIIELHQRYQKEMEETRSKLASEISLQRQSFAEEKRRDLTAFDKALQKAERYGNEVVERLRTQHLEEVEETRRKAKVELKRLKERFEIEKEDWQNEIRHKMQLEADAKLKELRERMKRKRDEAIGVVVEKISNEAAEIQKQMDKKSETEKKLLLKTNQEQREEWSRKYDESMRLYREVCGSFQEVKHALEQRSSEHDLSKKRVSQLEARLANAEADKSFADRKWQNLLEDIEKEGAERMAANNALHQQMKVELELAIGKLRSELEETKSRQGLEMSTVEAKVRAAMAKKDSTIEKLKCQLDLKESKISHMQNLLSQQKRDLFASFKESASS